MMISLLAFAAFLTACGSQAPAPNSYLSTSSTQIFFLQWTDNNGQLSGQLQEVYISSTNPLQVQKVNESITGILSGSQISLSISMFGITKTITGSFTDSTLKLVVPNQNGQLDTMTLHSATVDDYNKFANSFELNINKQATIATATAQAQVPYTQNNQFQIIDQANVLNVSQVQSGASDFPDAIVIYTVNNFTGVSTDFDQHTRSHVTSNNMIVIAIDTVHKHLAIVGGSGVPLSDNQYSVAISTFVTTFKSSNGDYTSATIAAIQSLRNMLM